MSVSIIVASFNYERFIRQTLDSLIEQSFSDWEAIIVDDGSSDNSLAIIREYEALDSRIRLYTHEGNVNRGLQETLKLGLAHCTGEWISFCESDDWWATECLEKRFEMLKAYPDAGVVFNTTFFVEEDQKTVYRVKGKIAQRFKENPLADMSPFYPDQNPVLTFSSVMVKKALFEQCDMDSPVPVYLDCWLWSQIAFISRFLLVDEPLTYWRQHAVSYTKRENSGAREERGVLMGRLRSALRRLLIRKNPNQRMSLIWMLGILPELRKISSFIYQRKIDVRYERIFVCGFRVAKIAREL